MGWRYLTLALSLILGISSAGAQQDPLSDLIKLFGRVLNQPAPQTPSFDPSRPPDATSPDYSSTKTTTSPILVYRDRETVREVQKRLMDAGYNAGIIDGLWGGKTSSAIQAYQRDHGLAVDGQITEPLLAELRKTEAVTLHGSRSQLQSAAGDLMRQQIDMLGLLPVSNAARASQIFRYIETSDGTRISLGEQLPSDNIALLEIDSSIFTLVKGFSGAAKIDFFVGPGGRLGCILFQYDPSKDFAKTTVEYRDFLGEYNKFRDIVYWYDGRTVFFLFKASDGTAGSFLGDPQVCRKQLGLAAGQPGLPPFVVLVIDGMDPIGEFIPLYEGRPGGATISYLGPRIEEVWGQSEGDVHYVPWTGRTSDTPLAVQQMKGFVSLLIQKANNENKPFVILGHSWGSVIAYRALTELYGEGKVGSGDIDEFVTLGSPLGTRQALIQKIVRANAIWTGSDAVGVAVREWRNYYIEQDLISGAIEDGRVIDELLSQDETSPLKAHRAYFDNDALLRQIGVKVRNALAALLPEPSGDPTVEAPAETSAVTTHPQILPEPATEGDAVAATPAEEALTTAPAEETLTTAPAEEALTTAPAAAPAPESEPPVTSGASSATDLSETSDESAFFGLGVNHHYRGLVISAIAQGGPADVAGLRPGDVILEFDGIQVNSEDHFTRMVSRRRAGESISFVIRRDGEKRSLKIVAGRKTVEGEFDATVNLLEIDHDTGTRFGIRACSGTTTHEVYGLMPESVDVRADAEILGLINKARDFMLRTCPRARKCRYCVLDIHMYYKSLTPRRDADVFARFVGHDSFAELKEIKNSLRVKTVYDKLHLLTEGGPSGVKLYVERKWIQKGRCVNTPSVGWLPLKAIGEVPQNVDLSNDEEARRRVKWAVVYLDEHCNFSSGGVDLRLYSGRYNGDSKDYEIRYTGSDINVEHGVFGNSPRSRGIKFTYESVYIEGAKRAAAQERAERERLAREEERRAREAQRKEEKRRATMSKQLAEKQNEEAEARFRAEQAKRGIQCLEKQRATVRYRMKDNSENAGETVLRNNIFCQSKGLIELSVFHKVDGRSREFQGIKQYELMYGAEIKFTKDLWWQGPSVLSDADFFAFERTADHEDKRSWTKYQITMVERMVSKNAGEKEKIYGAIRFEESERGWWGGPGDIRFSP